MEVYIGKTISRGIAIGRLYYYAKENRQVKPWKVQDPQEEVRRFDEARKQSEKELNKLYEKAVQEAGAEHAEIFQVHAMMLQDEEYTDSVREIICSQNVNAEYAVSVVGDQFAEMFSQMEDEYFRARSADIRDISERMISVLTNKQAAAGIPPTASVLAAEDLMPSETIQMEKQHLLGFVTRTGSGSSHTAILARTMGIPAISGISIRPEWDGKLVILDAQEGRLILEPEEEIRKELEKRMQEERAQKQYLESYKGKETCTRSGKQIDLYANVGSMEDLRFALEQDAEGIGLLRSEFLYLEKQQFPTEEEQFQIYKAAAETMAGKRLVIRTLDIGADKQAAYFGLEKEENPAMGYRAIRICLDKPEIFKTQLRAIFRASAYGKIAVMYPMIVSLEEVQQIRKIAEEVKQELQEARISYDAQIEQGIMIETPAAALISDQLAGEVDFFSIGTNDLSQYTLAIDRQNEHLERFFDPHHPALLRLIEQTVKNGHTGGCWVGICGELGADLELTEWYLKIGVDELSVAPAEILPLRKKIRELP